jgi:hypothetical protein
MRRFRFEMVMIDAGELLRCAQLLALRFPKPGEAGKIVMNESKSGACPEAEIERLEIEEAEARVALDVARLDALWSDQLIINATENIVYSKDHFMLRIKSGQVRFRSFERKISRLTVKGDVVVTTGNESVVPAIGPDMDQTVYCSYMNVWAKGLAGWQLLGRQVAVIARASGTRGWVF